MAPLDAVSLPDISDDLPAGENLENDAEFGKLERAAAGKAETQFEAGEPPVWKEVVAIADSLNARTHDLRVLVHMAIAQLHLNGVPAFAAVLGQIRNQLDQHWATVHPQLDPEDDNDPMQRSNALTRLRDPVKVLRTLRDMPLAGSKRKIEVTWRDIVASNGFGEPEPGREKLTEAGIRQAFQETDAARLEAQMAAVELAAAEAAAIPDAFDRHGGFGTGPDFKDLQKLLQDMLTELRRFQPDPEADGGAEAEGDAADESGPAPSGPARPARSGGFASVRAISSVPSREDALHLLDVAAAYFRTNEPSSPAPMLIDRAKRLCTMDFMDILRDLAPDGLSQAQTVVGSTKSGDDD